jgi:hypothetical protein
MLRQSVMLLCVLSVAFVGVGSASAVWTVVDLGPGNAGTFASGTDSNFEAINGLGNVAYMSSAGAGYFYNKSAGTVVALGGLGLPTYNNTYPMGINDNNIVVGKSLDASPFLQAFAWKWNGGSGGTMVNLTSTLSTNAQMAATSINANNQVTGFANDPFRSNYQTGYIADVTHAWDPTPSVPWTWTGVPSTTGHKNAFSINDHGVWVGVNSSAPVTNLYYDGNDPTLASSYASTLAKASGVGNACFAYVINNAGYAICGSPTANHATNWIDQTTVGSTTTTFLKDIPLITGATSNIGSAMNNNAVPQITGTAVTGSGNRAYIWNYGDAAATDLNTYATGLGAANLTGWTFTHADGINNNKEIVGYGTLASDGGATHVFALLDVTPAPEPSTLLLLASGLAGLLAYAWRKRR